MTTEDRHISRQEAAPGRGPGGRFVKGNKIGSAGRTKGARDRIYREYDAAYAEGADKAIAKIKELGLAGDLQALAIWDRHIAVPRKDAPLCFDVSEVKDEASAIAAGYVVCNDMLQGHISPLECAAVLDDLHKTITLRRLQEIESKLAAIEQRLGERR
jgi:hypothetical protein